MGFWTPWRNRKLRVGIYVRVSTADQQTLPMQLDTIRTYLRARKWKTVMEVDDIGSGAKDRKKRQQLMVAARQREIDAIVVWKLDRWGRSLHDLVSTLQELSELEVGFVSITEAIDLTTPIGRATAGLLAVFAEFERELLKERVKSGIAQARKKGKPHGRPQTVQRHADKARKLFNQGLSKSEIARRLSIGRTSVIRLLAN
jgi:DNA invertase Pin-like site-specific DNA recombinase